MTNIIKFPNVIELSGTATQYEPKAAAKAVPSLKGSGVFACVVKIVWVVTVLVWPLLRWIISLDVVFQLLQMMYYWHTPGVHAGWTVLMHFGVLTALTCFVALYKPKGV